MTQSLRTTLFVRACGCAALLATFALALTLGACGRTTLEGGPGAAPGDAGADLAVDGAPVDAATDLGPDLGPDLGGPDLGGPDLGGPDLGGPDLGGPDMRLPCGGDDCSRLDGACVVGRCDADADACVAEPRADGTVCDDGQACTVRDFCERGVCTGRGGPDCTAFDTACTVGVCEDATGACRAEPVPTGTACEDGDPCSVGDSCARGVCRAGAPLDCTGAGDDCNLGVCNPMSGACEAIPLPSGTPCEDGLVCTEGDRCTDGLCDAGADVDCTALDDECLVGTCSEDAGGCVAEPELDGIPCDDGDVCTERDFCLAGACFSGATVVPLGDTCAMANTLDGDDGLQTLDASTVCASSEVAGSCGGTGPDILYDLELTAPRRVRFETVPPGMGRFDTVLHLRETCASATTELLCDDDDGDGTLSLLDEVVAPGSYTLAVDGFSGVSRGDFTLEVDIETPDTCATAVPLELPAEGATTSISSTTAGATNGAVSTCASGARSPDHLYEIEVTTRTTLRIETVAPTTYDTALHVRAAPCATSPTLFCDDDLGAGTLSRIEESFAPGTYFLVVDGFAAGRSGDYTLEIENLGERGQAVLIGHDYFTSTTDQNRVVGNAVLLTNATGTIDILQYTEFSDNTPGGEAANTRSAIDATVIAAGQTTRYTTLTNFRNLATSLVGLDVLLVHEQEDAGFQAVTVSTAWRRPLLDFLDRGGIVIVCSSLRDEWQILNGAGLFTITGDALVPSGAPALTVAAPGDPLLTGVTAYAPSEQTTSFAGSSGGTAVLETSTGAPVVRRLER
ncbi:MAG: hypothetical protein AAF447_04170 [Myxococcota bacterium]